MNSETFTVGSEGLTVTRIVWRRFRRRMPGLVERVLDSNPGLSAHVLLPVGLRLTLPIDPPRALVERPLVNLWD
jgi:phage tail protein X